MADHNAPCGCDELLQLRKKFEVESKYNVELQVSNHALRKQVGDLQHTIATALIEAKIYNGIPEMDKIAAILEAAVREVGR